MSTPAEPILDPDLPLVDAHHHLWFLTEAVMDGIEAQDCISTRALAPTFRRYPRYLFDEFMQDLRTGHNIRMSVFVEARAMYRVRRAQAMRSVGEVEFANGVAAMGDSGNFGDIKVCAGIVGGVDLRLGDEVEEVLNAHIRAGGARYRGIRSPGVVHDDDERILGRGNGVPQLLLDKTFRTGVKWLQRFGLAFDAWLLEPQLPDLIDLARAFPEVQIVLNHVGAPVGIGRYAGRREERFPVWRDNIRTLSRCGNVAVKLGGLGIPFGGFASFRATPQASSEALASEWRPYIETCIEAFGASRCMFESNFPVDSATCTYPTLWNAFKRLAAGASNEEKTALFSGTAIRIYGLD